MLTQLCLTTTRLCEGLCKPLSLLLKGSIANKFYVHNDIFRYQDEVFDGFVTVLQEESKEEVEEPEERQHTTDVVPVDSGASYDQTVSNDLEEHLEEPVVEPEPEPKPEPEPEPVSDIQKDKPKPALKEAATEDVQKSASLAPADVALTQEDLKTFSWLYVTNKTLPPSEAVPVRGYNLMWSKCQRHSPVQNLSLTLRSHHKGLRKIREFESNRSISLLRENPDQSMRLVNQEMRNLEGC